MTTDYSLSSNNWKTENNIITQKQFNGCYRAIQSNDLNGASFWLSQIEKQFLAEKAKAAQHNAKLHELRQLAFQMIVYSATSRSPALVSKEKDLFQGHCTEHKVLRKILRQIYSHDLVNFRIPDILRFYQAMSIENERLQCIETEGMVQSMITMYQQQIIDEVRLLAYFKRLDDYEITKYFYGMEIVYSPNGYIYVVCCFQKIVNMMMHINKRFVHEVFICTSDKELYEMTIPEICWEAAVAHSSRFQAIFRFRVWSIWEERRYIKSFPSYQIWELHRLEGDPGLQFSPFKKENFHEAKERYDAAREFFIEAQKLHQSSATLSCSGKVILANYLCSMLEDDETEYTLLQKFLTNMNIGPVGQQAKDDVNSEDLLMAGLQIESRSEVGL
ncbi:hypothetical protein M6B38_254440 [Iris pallida]|uniref:Uncharacterized protein n=1 Tax=Iris pallida TaxID=29817 RepID=A0AAX6IH85_IRIPA|nr:hypothetical protein M6B38_254440 [Iris pallida]